MTPVEMTADTAAHLVNIGYAFLVFSALLAVFVYFGCRMLGPDEEI